MTDTHQEIYLFLQGKSNKGLSIIYNIFLKQLYSASYKYLLNREDKEDLFMDFITKIFEKREFLIRRFADQERGLASYVREMAKNFLKDKIAEMSEVYLESVNDYEWKLEDGKADPQEVIVRLDAFSIKEWLDENLKKEEILMLCYMLSEDKEKFEKDYFKELSKDAIYKRVQRLKEKLSNLLKNYSKETFAYYIEYILPTVCKEVSKNG